MNTFVSMPERRNVSSITGAAVRAGVAIIGATAKELNEELTILLSALDGALQRVPFGDPARRDLLAAREAAVRLSTKAWSLQQFASSAGPVRTTVERLLNG